MITKDGVEILGIIASLTISLCGMIWYVGEAKAAIYKEIDRCKDELDSKLTQLDKRLDLHIQSSQSAREKFEYQLRGQGERMGGEIEQLKKRMSGAIVFEKLEEKLDKVLDKLNNN
jgi:hypothetical protein